MVNTITIQANAAYCIGDLHGNINTVAYQIKQYDIHNAVIICCGDVGLGFYKKEYYKQEFNKIKKTLAKYDDYLIFIRGNHDNPKYFDGKIVNDKRIKAVPDYTVLQLCEKDEYNIDYARHTILCIGGATSIDRTQRLTWNARRLHEYIIHHSGLIAENIENIDVWKLDIPMTYWVSEQPVYDEEKLDFINQNFLIDTVATHTCPSFCEPQTKDGIRYWMKMDEDLERDIDNERETMDKIYRKLGEKQFILSNWCYGHYHFHNMSNIDGIRFTLLDMERNGKLDMLEIYNAKNKWIEKN